MRKPNDKYRPNTNSGREKKARRDNPKYLHISKGLPFPYKVEDGTTIMIQPKGVTYVRPKANS